MSDGKGVASIESCFPLPEGASIQKKGRYFVLVGCHDHPLAGLRGRIPFHRFVLYEKLGRPDSARCHWCGYLLPWKTSIANAVCHVVVADHLDADTMNNHPQNLVPSCSWCNANRNWAEKHTKFWGLWRKWMKDVPPSSRPNLPHVALDFGITAIFDKDQPTL